MLKRLKYAASLYIGIRFMRKRMAEIETKGREYDQYKSI